jgi:hypothetical protein
MLGQTGLGLGGSGRDAGARAQLVGGRLRKLLKSAVSSCAMATAALARSLSAAD